MSIHALLLVVFPSKKKSISWLNVICIVISIILCIAGTLSISIVSANAFNNFLAN